MRCRLHWRRWPTPRFPPGMASSASDPTHLRVVEVDHLVQLADVPVAVADEVDEGLDVEGEAYRLELHRRLVVVEIVVAVDQDRPVRLADGGGEAVRGEVGEGQVDRALDVALGVSGGGAGVEDQRAGFGGRGGESVPAD